MRARWTGIVALLVILAGVGGCVAGSGLWVVDWFTGDHTQVTISHCIEAAESPEPGVYCFSADEEAGKSIVGADHGDVGREVDVFRTAGAPGHLGYTHLFTPGRGDAVAPALAGVAVLLGLAWLGLILMRRISSDPDVT